MTDPLRNYHQGDPMSPVDAVRAIQGRMPRQRGMATRSRVDGKRPRLALQPDAGRQSSRPQPLTLP